jgi:hypothetical protein
MTFDLLSNNDMFRRRTPSSGLVQYIKCYNYLQFIVFSFCDAFGIPLRLQFIGRQFLKLK